MCLQNDGSGSEGEAWDAEDADSDGGNVDDDDEEDAKPIFLAPSEVEAQFRALWREEKAIVTRIWGRKFGLVAKTAKQEPGYALKRRGTFRGLSTASPRLPPSPAAVVVPSCLCCCSWTQFFIRSLLVPPNKFRPPQKGLTGDGVFEHVQNMFYTKALNLNASLVAAGVGSADGKAKATAATAASSDSDDDGDDGKLGMCADVR
jgi:hypothetical protein